MRTHTIGKCVCGLAIWKRIVLACGAISSYPGPQASVSAVIPNSQETPNSWRQDGHLPRIPLLHRVKRASRRRSRSNLPEGWWNALAAYKYRCNKTAGPLLRPRLTPSGSAGLSPPLASRFRVMSERDVTNSTSLVYFQSEKAGIARSRDGLRVALASSCKWPYRNNCQALQPE